MTEKKKRPPEAHLLAQMKGSHPKCTHQFPQTPADQLRSKLPLKPCRATMRDGCDDCDGVFGGGVLPSHRRGGK